MAPGRAFPRVGFIVTNLSRPAERVVAFYNQRGTCEKRIREGKGAIKWTRLSCRSSAANAVRLQLNALAYNLGNFMRTLAMPYAGEPWSLISLREKLIKIRAEVVSHGRHVTFRMAEGRCHGRCSRRSCGSSRDCGRRPHRREGHWGQMQQTTTAEVRLDRGKPAVLRRLARGTRRGRSLLPWAAKNQTMAVIRFLGAKKNLVGHVIDDIIAKELSGIVGENAYVIPGRVIPTGRVSLNELMA